VAYFAHIGGFAAGFGLAILMLRTKMIEMERDETSILELLGLDKKAKPQGLREDMAYWQQEWGSNESKETKQEAAISERKKQERQYIRLRCRCGQRVRVPSQYAGRMGRCPKCSARWRIPEV
jgi:hypothetical protein